MKDVIHALHSIKTGLSKRWLNSRAFDFDCHVFFRYARIRWTEDDNMLVIGCFFTAFCCVTQIQSFFMCIHSALHRVMGVIWETRKGFPSPVMLAMSRSRGIMPASSTRDSIYPFWWKYALRRNRIRFCILSIAQQRKTELSTSEICFQMHLLSCSSGSV